MAKDKIVLAYSGGLDTTVAVPWLREKYDADIITLTIDLGMVDLESIRQRARQVGAATALTDSRSNMQGWHFVVVTDPAKRTALAEIYRRGWEAYVSLPAAAPNLRFDDPERAATQVRVSTSAQYLADHLQEVPVHVIPCIEGRTNDQPVVLQSAQWCTIGPASWSFMLAARTRGLGSVFTCIHLFHEEEAAEVVGIPYDRVMQAGLIPVAYYKGNRFSKAPREPLEKMVHWEGW